MNEQTPRNILNLAGSALSELPGGWIWARLGDVMDSEFLKPQINADERRFVNLNIQYFSEIYKRNSLIKSPQSTQRAQSAAIPAPIYEYKRRHDEEHG
ncbi:MAG TPA: hypothetical protein VN316_01235 [candidate division Zixibacteria bacterium]|nr:hypothetical protein [candidate division Zixibacteria bacterium]